MTDSYDHSPEPDAREMAPTREADVDLELAMTEEPRPVPRPWGPWATMGWTVLCIVLLFLAQIAGAIIFAVLRVALTGSSKFDDLATNGNLVAIATVLSTSATVGVVALLIYFRHYPIRDYLALYWPPARTVLIAMVGLAGLLIATDVTSYLLGKPLVPPIMVTIYRSSWLPGLVLALVVLAPVGEETLFRGFLYKGLAASPGGPVLAIVVSSVIFAMLHGFQYDLYAVAGVTAMGFFLGFARYRTGSLLLTVCLHAIANAVATLELIIQEHWFK